PVGFRILVVQCEVDQCRRLRQEFAGDRQEEAGPAGPFGDEGVLRPGEVIDQPAADLAILIRTAMIQAEFGISVPILVIRRLRLEGLAPRWVVLSDLSQRQAALTQFPSEYRMI